MLPQTPPPTSFPWSGWLLRAIDSAAAVCLSSEPFRLGMACSHSHTDDIYLAPTMLQALLPPFPKGGCVSGRSKKKAVLSPELGSEV